jgi:hypothetical protein
MNIIRDNQLGGLAMIPLFCDWGVRRCNVEDCTQQPTTIITGVAPDCPPIGMCEEHFQAANQGEGVTYTFVFDEFDAFKKQKADEEER